MIILITGGCGFVGLNLVSHLARQAPTARLVVADRPATADELGVLADRVDFHPLDVTDREACMELVRSVGPTHLVHAAAVTSPGRDDAARTIWVNCEGSRNVLDAAVAAGTVKRCLVLSSSGVYSHSGRTLCTEDADTDRHNPYARSKLIAEALMTSREEAGGFPIVACRIGPVYGPFEKTRATRPNVSLIQTLLDRLSAGRTLRVQGTDFTRDWTHASDVAAALLGLLLAPRLHHRIYNVSAGSEVSARAIIGQFVGHGLDVEWVGPGDSADLVLGAGDDRPVLDIRRLRRDTGFTPALDLEHGLTQLIAATPRSHQPGMPVR